MRISVNQGDPAFDVRLGRSHEARILVDGVAVANCFTADEEKGEAWCFALNDDGQMYIDPASQEPAVSVLRGVVKIVVRPLAGEV